MRALAVIDGEHYRRRRARRRSPSCRTSSWRRARRWEGEAARRRGLRRPARGRSRGGRSRVRAGRRRRPLGRAGARASGAASPRQPRARARLALRRRRLPLRPARLRADGRAHDRGRGNRQARRQDGGHGEARPARRRDARRGRRRRWDGAGRRSRSSSSRLPRSTSSSSARARDATPPPTISRQPSSPASSPSAAGVAAEGLAGETWVSNVLEGVSVAAARRPDLLVFDGSGAAMPPVDADAPHPRRLCPPGRGRRHRVPECLPDPGLRSRRPDDGRGRQRGAPRRSRRSKRVPIVGCELRHARSSPLPGGGRRSSRPALRPPTIWTPRSSTPRRAWPTATLFAPSSRGSTPRSYLAEIKAAADRRRRRDGWRAAPRSCSPTTSRSRFPGTRARRRALGARRGRVRRSLPRRMSDLHHRASRPTRRRC